MVSTYRTQFPFDFGLAMTPSSADDPRGQAILDDPPEWLQDWAGRSGQARGGLREGPSFIAFAREDGRVYHTYRCRRPIPSSPVPLLPARADAARAAEEPRAWRKDEYPD